jgi:CBS domain containing-hemolysin-like protein
MKLLLIIILLTVLLNAIIIDKALGMLSPKELKRRARAGHDLKAAAIFKMAGYDRSLSILLWIKGSLAAAVLFILLAKGSWLGGFIFIAVTGWLVRVWQPGKGTGSWVWSWAATVAPLTAMAMGYLQPILGRLAKLTGNSPIHRHGVYEKEDLVDLLAAQAKQPDNRIPEQDLRVAANALIFGDKTVSTVLTPLRKVRLVSESEQVGPLLMDELFGSGFSRFPVTAKDADKSSPKIVGTLYIKDLIGHTGAASVSGIMDKKVYYINETASLREALDALLRTRHHLFVVVNDFEEIVGVLSVEDVVEQILGKQIIDEFDRYDDLRAVATQDAKKEHQTHKATHLEPVHAAVEGDV